MSEAEIITRERENCARIVESFPLSRRFSLQLRNAIANAIRDGARRDPLPRSDRPRREKSTTGPSNFG